MHRDDGRRQSAGYGPRPSFDESPLGEAARHSDGQTIRGQEWCVSYSRSVSSAEWSHIETTGRPTGFSIRLTSNPASLPCRATEMLVLDRRRSSFQRVVCLSATV